MSDILVPTSVGELVDKITILRIKSERITDKAKLVNITNELAALTQTCAQHKIDLTTALVAALQDINGQLWKIEDDIREKERQSKFDSEFIELARSVYVMNDKRAELKKQINLASGSKYVEEKSYKPY